MEMQNLSGTGEKKGEKDRWVCQYPSGRGKVVSSSGKVRRKRNPARSGKKDYGYFQAAFEGKSGRKPKEGFGKYEQLEKKIKYQQQLLLDKYLEGLVEESLYQIKERELQNKLKNNTGSRTCRQKNRDFLAEEQEEVEKRLRETEQFLKEHHVILKAHVLCELKMVEKILIYPDHLEVVKKQGKCIIAAETLDMLY